jgi:hypothetical protein
MMESRDAAMQALRSELLNIMARVDDLGLHQAGAHLFMAIHALDLERAVRSAPTAEGSGK